jgi:exopolysaccharide production protein ExoZ
MQLARIQVLRGMAAMLVVFHHYNGTAAAHGFDFHLLSGATIGHIGVDIFFVISGFIMELTTGGPIHRKGDAMVFLVRRSIRIFPLYWILTVVAFLAAKILGSEINNRFTVVEFLDSMLLLPSTGTDGKALYVIGVAWSLTYELYFYILFAALLRFRSEIRLIGLAGLFILSVLMGCIYHPSQPFLHMLTDPILFEFFLGVVLACLVRYGLSLERLAGSALIALSIATMLSEFDSPISDNLRVLFFGIPAAVLVYGVVLSQGLRLNTLLLPLAYLGDISYSLYLSHFFTIAIFVRIYKKWSMHMPVPHWLAAIALFGMCILVAHLCYKLIENPSRRTLGRLVAPWKAKMVQT